VFVVPVVLTAQFCWGWRRGASVTPLKAKVIKQWLRFCNKTIAAETVRFNFTAFINLYISTEGPSVENEWNRETDWSPDKASAWTFPNHFHTAIGTLEVEENENLPFYIIN